MDRIRKQRAKHSITDTERRASARYALTLAVHYTTVATNGPVRLGTGKTIDLSSSGLSFTADTPLLVGQKIKAYIDWPVMLNGNVGLQLQIWGVVVRVDGTDIAIQIKGHDFKTRSVKPRSA